MRTIGIMTMHRIQNYGSFLQAFALKKILESFDNKVQFIDYKKVEFEKVNAFFKIKITLFHFFLNLFPILRKKSKRIKANEIECLYLYKVKYNKYLKKWLKIDKNTFQPSGLDCLLIGSDEVFNIIHNNLKLFGADSDAKKIVSFAASFGNTCYGDLEQKNLVNELSSRLNSFYKISVRDQNSYNICSRLVDKPVYCFLDPVFHYDFENFVPRKAIKKKYILVYAYSKINCQIKEEIKRFADKNNLEIICLLGFQDNFGTFIAASPFETLRFFRDAQYVFTTTFHGCAFGAKYNKKLAINLLKKNGNNYNNEFKLFDLIKRLKLDPFLFENPSSLEKTWLQDFDYSETNKIISDQVSKGIDYLKKI